MAEAQEAEAIKKKLREIVSGYEPSVALSPVLLGAAAAGDRVRRRDA